MSQLTGFNLVQYYGQENAFKIRVAARAAGLDVTNTFVGVSDVPKGLTVPYVKLEGGQTLTQSNAICRMVARASKDAKLYGADFLAMAEVDQWLEFFKTEVENPSVVVNYQIFGVLPFDKRDFNQSAQIVLQKLQTVEAHLKGKEFMVGDSLTLADITLVTSLLHLFRFYFHKGVQNKKLKNITRVFTRLTQSATFTAEIGRVVLCQAPLTPQGQKGGNAKGGKGGQKGGKGKGKGGNQQGGKGGKKGKGKGQQNQKPKQQQKKKSKRPKHWSALLPKSDFNFNDFKNEYFNTKTEEAEAKCWAGFWEKSKTCFTDGQYSFWKVEYEPLKGECEDILRTQNLLGMFTQKVGSFGKFMFGNMGVYGKQGKLYVRGVWMIRGENPNPPELTAIASWEFYNTTRLDPLTKPADRALVMEYWTKQTEKVEPEVASEPDSDSPDSSDSEPEERGPLDPGHPGDVVEGEELLDNCMLR